MIYPIVRYEVAGRTFEIVGNGRHPAEFDVGQKVAVTYFPERPERGRIVGFQQQLLPPLVLVVFGALFGGGGIVSLCAALGWRRVRTG